ncbi:MAG: MFS transporter [bacterium]
MQEKATRIELGRIDTPQMRAFHLSWMAFFVCFFAWFGIAPLMPIIRDDLGLTRDQVGWTIIASVSITFVARLTIGWLCDRIGPRLTYTALLVFGAFPVMGVALADDFASFLVFRLLIGVIGAGFVITQVHTSLMFAPNCVGTANATTAGWGNLGGGVTQLAMPLLLATLVGSFGLSESVGWRLTMVATGLLCLLMAGIYYRFTQDTPEGNLLALRRAGQHPPRGSSGGGFLDAARDGRVWVLFFAYAICFGIGLTIANVSALYFLDNFAFFHSLERFEALQAAGLIAGGFGMMNLFARSLGGYVSDRIALWKGSEGRVRVLFGALFLEGCALMLFSQITALAAAVGMLLIFALFNHMAAGVIFSIVPFVNRRVLGPVAGIVGAGGNLGGIASAFLFKADIDWAQSMFALGVVVTAGSVASLLLRIEAAGDSELAVTLESSVRAKSASV